MITVFGPNMRMMHVAFRSFGWLNGRTDATLRSVDDICAAAHTGSAAEAQRGARCSPRRRANDPCPLWHRRRQQGHGCTLTSAESDLGTEAQDDKKRGGLVRFNNWLLTKDKNGRGSES